MANCEPPFVNPPTPEHSCTRGLDPSIAACKCSRGTWSRSARQLPRNNRGASVYRVPGMALIKLGLKPRTPIAASATGTLPTRHRPQRSAQLRESS
jgi:hypothetical protein